MKCRLDGIKNDCNDRLDVVEKKGVYWKWNEMSLRNKKTAKKNAPSIVCQGMMVEKNPSKVVNHTKLPFFF